MKRNNVMAKGLNKLVILLMVLVMAFFAFPLAACSSPEEEPSQTGGSTGGGGNKGESDLPEEIPAGSVRVTINYLRPKADYTSWNVWIWIPGEEGAAYEFKKQNVKILDYDWKTLTVDVPKYKADNVNAIGFIVRKGDWDEKDIGADRFVPNSRVVDRAVTIYLGESCEEIYYEAEPAFEAATACKVTKAVFTDFNKVSFNTNREIGDTSIFKVYDGDTVLGTLDCTQESNKMVGKTAGTITLSDNIVMNKPYVIKDEPTVEFNDKKHFASRAISKTPLYEMEEFEDLYDYDGKLGVEYSAAKSVFRVWSPVASEIKLNIYAAGTGGEATTTDMTIGDYGVWTATVNGDLNGKYYTYTVTAEGATREIVDPYARSGGTNGLRGMVLDLASTNPDGWDTQEHPTLASPTDAVIYEAHVRDMTIHKSSNVSAANRGKFLGMTEKGTGDAKTPLQYIKELGITAVHFQPMFDFKKVDENFTTATFDGKDESGNPQYNWGYDPLNYNMPEGSYSSDPSDGFKRVNEMKQMIMALHNEGIQVIMDVVYNHVADAGTSNFEALVPGYYFRYNDRGGLSNGSGCGNETASERYMFGRFMVDSVKYWTEEYDIDGFRFDLMGVHDIATMNEIYYTLADINPDVLLYGEGWTGGDCALDSKDQAIMKNCTQMPHIAMFDDIIRDGLKGGSFNGVTETGFVSGKKNTDYAVYVGAAGASINVVSDKYFVRVPFANDPTQNINYASCHDNSTLWDKLNASAKDSAEVLMAMNRLAATSVLTSQGISFFLAGEELLRSKPTTAQNDYDNRPNVYKTKEDYYFSDNSYKSPDSTNAIDWTLATTNKAMVDYYKGLIALKKALPMLHIDDPTTLAQCLVMIDGNMKDNVAVYAVKDPDSDTYAVFIYNATKKAKTIAVPNGSYSVFVKGNKASATALESFTGASMDVEAYSAIVMTGTLDEATVKAWTYSVADVAEE